MLRPWTTCIPRNRIKTRVRSQTGKQQELAEEVEEREDLCFGQIPVLELVSGEYVHGEGLAGTGSSGW
jgi:hypothetical protein